MRPNLPITTRKIRNHFHYSFWKYLLLIAIVLFGWNLIYTTTRYRSPDSLKVEFMAQGSYLGDEKLQSLADKIRTDVMPEMEEVTATAVNFDDMYGDMQLVVWVSAGQGDVYLLSKEKFQSMAANEATMDLQPYIDSGALHTDGMDLTNGYVLNTDTGVSTLMGIPVDSLAGLADYGLPTENMVLCALVNNGNDTYTIKFMDYLLTHLKTATTDTAAEIATLTGQP